MKVCCASPINLKDWMDVKSDPFSREESSFDLSNFLTGRGKYMNTPRVWGKFIYFLIQQSEAQNVVSLAFDLAENQSSDLHRESEFTVACWKPEHPGRTEEEVRLLLWHRRGLLRHHESLPVLSCGHAEHRSLMKKGCAELTWNESVAL